MNKLQKIGGLCAILEALIYIVTFIIYGAILVYPNTNASAVEELYFLKNNFLTVSIVNLISYVLFGIILSVMVLAIHQRLKKHAPIISKFASIFGIIWVGLVISSGMITNVGLSTVLKIGIREPENAILIWRSVGTVSEGLGGGNEIVGGIWVLLISAIGLKGQFFSKSLNVLGIIVGIAGMLSIYPLVNFTEIFGISQIIWFLWIGISMIRKPNISESY